MNDTSLSTSKNEYIQTALQAVYGLTLLHGVLDDNAGQSIVTLLTLLIAPEPDAVAIAKCYSQAFRALTVASNEETVLDISDAWQAHLLGRLLDDSNLVSIQVERVGRANVSKALYTQLQRDVQTLQLLFALSAETLWEWTCEAVTPSLPALRDAWIPWRDLAPLSTKDGENVRNALAQRVAESTDWIEIVDPLIEYWSRHGTGLFARYSMLRWQGIDEGLCGIAHPDSIQLSALVAYQREQNVLKMNTERFLAGLPAHDTLLYGAPGTGKSSTVKALVNAYAEQGLRLVEVRKEYISDLPRVAALLRGRAPRFLLFIDDLSFEEHETEYKVLKMLLEGTAEARPANVLIYATTNRQNLIRENFSDRGKISEDVHWRDTMDEKLSLVHRFGLRVTFSTPDQERYLAIVVGLARLRGIDLPEELLRTRALQWERQHSNRSGRLARQFVDELEAEIGQLSKETL